MNDFVELASHSENDLQTLGNKAAMLARLQQEGFRVPSAFCLPAAVYHEFLKATGIASFIKMELQRKDFNDMRWEEIWDVSLRIRNHFVTRSWPQELEERLRSDIEGITADWSAAAVRSTAPGEDSANQSFAGLHESRLMLRTTAEILDAIRTVWASLWSDGALLYRQELNLDPGKSGMAVILQEMVVGDVSGVLFSRAPQNRNVMMIEAVWGLNQALVDGVVEPDRWQLDRATGQAVEKHQVQHHAALRPAPCGLVLSPLDEQEQGRSPLNPSRCRQLHQAALELEDLLGHAIDLEWTFSGEELYILQVRPVTTLSQQHEDDERPWYLSLHRSLETLEELQEELEKQVLPGMNRDAEKMAMIDLSSLDDHELADEHSHRGEILQNWLNIYKEKCIPMAHGLRLFGEFYNDQVKPDDPFEFLNLLHSDDLLAIRRNRKLDEMATILGDNPEQIEYLKKNNCFQPGSVLQAMLEDFVESYSGMNWFLRGGLEIQGWLVKLAEEEDLVHIPKQLEAENKFTESFPEIERAYAERVLKVARASYLLRDNDNLYLGKVRDHYAASEEEIRRRLSTKEIRLLREILDKQAVKSTPLTANKNEQGEFIDGSIEAHPRQMVGQPAGPGTSSGPARVLSDTSSLGEFKTGEVLVCDAIEPNMTFIVPLASAIIERRGGMLIHGAIIAREYGIPCVTGIPDATRIIKTGDNLSVDGYLGIVTIDRNNH